MSNSYQSEIPKARINIKLDLHTGNAQKKMELPLKLLVTGDFSNGQEQRVLSERQKVNVNKNNFDSVLAEFSPALNISVENTLAGDGSEESVRLIFRDMKDFTPEQVGRYAGGRHTVGVELAAVKPQRSAARPACRIACAFAGNA